MRIPEAIRKLREEEGLTRRSLSILCKLSDTFIEYIEYGKKTPSYRSLTKIADAVHRNMKITYSADDKITDVEFLIIQGERPKRFDERLLEVKDRLYYDCLKMCRYNEANARDLCQDVLEYAITYPYRFNETSQLHTWLYSIARNKNYDNIKKHSRIEFVEDFIETAEETEEISFYPEIKKYICNLSDTEKRVYKMRLLNIPHKEIARELNLDIGTVRNCQYNTKRQIKLMLARDKKLVTL